MNAIITLQEYLKKGKTFVVPEYQRGYVWGKKRVGEEKDSVTNLMEDLISHFNKNADVFLQGITVAEKEKEIILIDGQQRTTFLFLLLICLNSKENFKIEYNIRKASQEYLEALMDNDDDIKENSDEEYQDIFFFKKTLRIVKSELQEVKDIEVFKDFLLGHVQFLYINVPEDQAIKIFTMMNGSKAQMLTEEIIKAEILRLASLNDDSKIDDAKEWEYNMLRSRYAREWDKWLHWWNRKDVQDMYGCSNPMGLLISSYLQQKKGKIFTFENFKEKCLTNATAKEARTTFDGLRRLQKRFEDAFDNPETHNRIGAILNIFESNDRHKFINYYFVQDNRNSLKEYYMLAFLGMSHDDILKKDPDKVSEKYTETWDALSDNFLYLNNKEIAYRFLLRLNVDEDIKQGRKFNFEIWENRNRSLEHIFPKSKVVHKNGDKVLDTEEKEVQQPVYEDCIYREDIKYNAFTTTEHGIGNLVLLYKDENSSFNDSDFAVKKKKFFSPRVEKPFKSRHLLHTICVFAEQEKWDGESIAKNQHEILEKLKSDYQKYINPNEKQD